MEVVKPEPTSKPPKPTPTKPPQAKAAAPVKSPSPAKAVVAPKKEEEGAEAGAASDGSSAKPAYRAWNAPRSGAFALGGLCLFLYWWRLR